MSSSATPFALCLAVGLALSVSACEHASARPPTEPPPGEVWLTPDQVKSAGIEVESIEERPVGGAIRAASRITFDDLRVAHVYSPVTGRISSIVVQQGQIIKKGQVLCEIQSPDLGTADSDAAKARAVLVTAEQDWRRQKDLLSQHAASQRDYEASETAYFNAKAELERAQRKARLLGSAQTDPVSQDYLLRSPIGGEVIMRAANPGLEVQGQYSGGANVELFTIGDLDRVWAIADVFEEDLPRVRQGAPMAIRVLAYPQQVFEGAVEWISGALDPSSRTAKVRASVANVSGKLRPEMYATAAITVEADRKVAIRRSALLLLGEQPVTFVQTGTTPKGQVRFERRPIAVDETIPGDYVPVLGGVEIHDVVVVAGGVLLLGIL